MKKNLLIIVFVIVTVYCSSQTYIPPQKGEQLSIWCEDKVLSSGDSSYYDILIAKKDISKRILVSIPVLSSNFTINTTWLTVHYLYFYLLGDENINTIELKDFAAKNGIIKKIYNSDHSIVWPAKGVKLFRFDLQTGAFSDTGFFLHNDSFAVSPDDSRICVRRFVSLVNRGVFDKYDIYNLCTSACIKKDILRESFFRIKNLKEYCPSCIKQVFAHNIGCIIQNSPEFIWMSGSESPYYAGTVNWETLSNKWVNLREFRPNYYVCGGPVIVLSKPDKNALKSFSLSKGQKIYVSETGESTTIDDVTAPWMRIWCQNGLTGWVFGACLNKIQGSKICKILNH